MILQSLTLDHFRCFETIGAESSGVLQEAFDVPMRAEKLPKVHKLAAYIHLAERPDPDPVALAQKREEVIQIIELTHSPLE
jgi:hypothetical protein